MKKIPETKGKTVYLLEHWNVYGKTVMSVHSTRNSAARRLAALCVQYDDYYPIQFDIKAVRVR